MQKKITYLSPEEKGKETDFYYLFEDFFHKKQIDFGNDVDRIIGKFLKKEENRYEFEQYLIDNEILDNEMLNYNLEILSIIDKFYKGFGGKNTDFIVVNNPDYKKTQDQIIFDKAKKDIAKQLIKEGNEKYSIGYTLENSVLKELDLDKSEASVKLEYFNIEINGTSRIFTNELNSIDVEELLLMMNYGQKVKLKHFDFSIFSNWQITDIVTLEDYYGKKIANIFYIDNSSKKRNEEICCITDTGDILKLENGEYADIIFGITDILGYKFLGVGYTISETDCLLDLENKPVIVRGIYVKDIKKTNLKFNSKDYYLINDGDLSISEEDLLDELEKYVSYDVDDIVGEFVYE